MLLTLLRLALVFALLVALPGVLLVNACLPRRASSLSRPERAFLGLGAGMLLLMLVGVVLGLLPHEGSRGWFSSAATGFPMIELTMLVVSAGLFWVGLRRGAYPAVSSRWPQLARGVRRAAPESADAQTR